MFTPQVIDNFLPASFYDQLRAFVFAAPLTFGAKSNSKTDPHGHLAWQPIPEITRHNLADITRIHSGLPELLQNAWTMVRGKVIDQNPNGSLPLLIRCYVNAYAYGMDGYFHVDSQRADEVTVILYICDKWWPDWAGETVMMNGAHYWAALPAANRAIILPSNMNHAARAISRKCDNARMVLVFKCRPSRTGNFETLSKWLVDHGALKLKHAEGSLHDHLVRTFQLLEERKHDMQTCLGGGLHSIYGTNVFQQQLLKPEAHTRAEVAQTFGFVAGMLAYYFSLADRPATLENAVLKRKGEEMMREVRTTYGSPIEMTEGDFRKLALIECANLMDQGGLDKWPKLKAFWEKTS